MTRSAFSYVWANRELGYCWYGPKKISCDLELEDTCGPLAALQHRHLIALRYGHFFTHPK